MLGGHGKAVDAVVLVAVHQPKGRQELGQEVHVLPLADILSQINGRKHATTQVAPNLAYSDPKWQRLLCATLNAGPSAR